MQILTATIPKSAMTRTAAISLDISPLGTPASRFGQSGDSAEITLLSQRPLKPGDIELIWHWADGQTKR
ncbi:hypothetical protein ACTTAL_03585 [Rhodobacter capsulatus]|nr:hypothetical protein U713_07305 [Rhodobacter capsulatus YW2]